MSATLWMDDMISTTGVAYRALACASLMEKVLCQTALIRDQGAFCWPTPVGITTRHVATRDVAAAATRLLLEPTWDGVDSVPMLGPEDLSFDKMMAIAPEVIGKPVRYREMSMEDLRAMMVGRGARVWRKP